MSNEIICNIRVKQKYPLSSTLFGIDIDQLERSYMAMKFGVEQFIKKYEIKLSEIKK